MGKGGLKFLAAVLATGMAVTPFLGLDNLPRGLRQRIDAERTAYSESRAAFQRARGEVDQALRADPALFRARSMSTAFPERFRGAETGLAAAGRDMAELARLREADRRGDRAQAEQILRREQAARSAALAEASAMRAEASRWVEMKRNLPRHLRRMQQDYEALRAADLSPVAAAVQKAQQDWPEKAPGLQARLDALRAMPGEAETTWQSSEPLRRRALAGDDAGLDYAALLTAAETLRDQASRLLPARTQEIQSLCGQLYTAWDKVLVDLEAGQPYRQKIRTVRTRLAGPADSQGQVATEENWVPVSRAGYRAVEKNLGMAIEHKPAGKYDVESEKTAQPAGFAYMAPPGGNNRYGRWEDRGGQSVWAWYGQYALLRDLLSNRDYRSPDTREYQDYRNAQRRGRTYYGRDVESGTPRYGSEGSSTWKRYSGSTYARGGGFKESPYATRAGGYSSSKYASRGYREQPDATAPRRFGRGSSGWGGVFSGGSSKPGGGWSSYRSSRPSFGGGSFGGGGRRFGGGGRRR